MRAEEFVYEKLDKPKPPRLTESETLGQSMIEAGNDFGPGTNYGEMTFLKKPQTYSKVQLYRHVYSCFMKQKITVISQLSRIATLLF